MAQGSLYEFRINIAKDPETGQVVVEVPALDIADYGADAAEALAHLRDMVAFHLECLLAEGKSIPEQEPAPEGVYIKVKLPAHAA